MNWDFTRDDEKPLAQILVVDDEAAHARALCDTLRCCGYAATESHSASSALQVMATSTFDLMLTDLTMPGMDGIALLRAAQAIDPNLVGIVMTGKGSIDSAVAAMKVGALDYILKPFKLSSILPVLSRALVMRQLRLKNAELERSLHARAQELEIANKELEAFTQSVAHDLRSPLRVIGGYSERLLRHHSAELTEEVQRLLGYVSQGASRMEQLIDALLNLSRCSRGQLKIQQVEMAGLVAEVVNELRAQQAERELDIIVGNLPVQAGDARLMRQLFSNLLSNAFKFTRARKPAIIEIGSRVQDGVNFYYVRDNGAGFDMRYVDKLFGVFQRLHSEAEFEGTGIGLSIAARVVQRHGGRIWARSEVGAGATFQFTLPCFL